VFYEMLTGELPLGKFAPPSRKVEVDVRLDEVVLRALEKEPDRRYQQASHVKTDVETVARVPGSITVNNASVRERMFARLALGLFLAGMPGTLLLLTLSHRHDMALIFGGVTLLIALVFGCLSWRERLGKGVAIATITVLALFGIAAALLSEVIANPWELERRRIAIEQEAMKQQQIGDARQLPGVDSLPPVVVSTEPVSGSRDVAPGIVAVRVAFSKGMMPDNWSWSTAWSNSAPQVLGKPRYEADGRTCAVTAQLEPGRSYAFWLNSEHFQNFRDTGGRPAVPYLLIFETKHK
jgi:hypothetical protein